MLLCSIIRDPPPLTICLLTILTCMVSSDLCLFVMSYTQQSEWCLNTCSKMERKRNKSASVQGARKHWSQGEECSSSCSAKWLGCFVEGDGRNEALVHTSLNTNHSWPGCSRQMLTGRGRTASFRMMRSDGWKHVTDFFLCRICGHCMAYSGKRHTEIWTKCLCKPKLGREDERGDRESRWE